MKMWTVQVQNARGEWVTVANNLPYLEAEARAREIMEMDHNFRMYPVS